MDLPQDHRVVCGAVTLAVQDYGGDGTPVLLLHGGTRNLGDWGTVVPRLAARHRVVALDFRSHGASTPCGAEWSFADAIDDVRAVVAALRLEWPWLVGHSIGGMVATGYAAEGGACRGVVNIDGVGISLPPVLPGPDSDAARQELQAMIAQMAAALAPGAAIPAAPLLSVEELAQRLSAQREATARRGESWQVTGPTAERAWYRREDGRYEENPSEAAVAALSQAVAGIDIFALTRRARCPLLFIGAVDPAAQSGEGADLMQRWRAGVRLAFEQIGRERPEVAWRGLSGDHMLVPYQAAAVANALLEFLRL
ncbi:MAG TPA: alpha/beta hydrolase [Roseiflexaceae bacterium]|nr:alpha/beta hydrolase [Roseiflexaceae bacterium]